ncbi:MAG: hypothetical protein SFV23_10630, partial [Planctomycetaceae bacterium]|nr:hypothetical protein [Planctomycetaceae bacterium]
MRIFLLAAVLIASAQAKDQPQWFGATIEAMDCEVDLGSGIATRGESGRGGGMPIHVVHCEFEFESADKLYIGKESVSRKSMLRLPYGSKVQIAIEKKALLLKSGESTRKMKLTAIQPKP